MKTIIEPFRIKMVEPIKMTTREERVELMKVASFNPFLLKAQDVIIDLLTDSGTSAMSADAWAAMMQGDESYAGARSWYRFSEVVKDIFGFEHVIPVHQGRAAERILVNVMTQPGSIVPNNTHFDTTRANIEMVGAQALDLPCKEAEEVSAPHPFKGNMDVDALAALIAEKRDKIPLVMLTVTNNSAGGQPVSMANIREVSRIAHEAGIPLYIDACRFAENAYFIKRREAGYEDKAPIDIAREMFSYADGCTMSAKKDAFANIGGFLCTRDPHLAERKRSILIISEGFPTYGGLAGRDLEAMAVGLREILQEDYLDYRLLSTRYVVTALDRAGVPLVLPAGGHAIYIDARKFLPHIPPLQYPGQALVVELYLEAGVRAVEVGTLMFGLDPHTGVERPARQDLVRLALPRRVYTQSHMDYVIEAVTAVWHRREHIRGLRIVTAPRFLRHFTVQLAPADTHDGEPGSERGGEPTCGEPGSERRGERACSHEPHANQNGQHNALAGTVGAFAASHLCGEE
jgi:tyrosine phenol-lyase